MASPIHSWIISRIHYATACLRGTTALPDQDPLWMDAIWLLRDHLRHASFSLNNHITLFVLLQLSQAIIVLCHIEIIFNFLCDAHSANVVDYSNLSLHLCPSSIHTRCAPWTGSWRGLHRSECQTQTATQHSTGARGSQRCAGARPTIAGYLNSHRGNGRAY